MSSLYYRPIPDPSGQHRLAGGWVHFSRVEVLSRSGSARLCNADQIPADVLTRLTAPRPPVAKLDLSRPRLMGILNVTPDSFSDGGQFLEASLGLTHARAMVQGGADILDIGGESTRPGADEVKSSEEIARTAPVIERLRAEGINTPISIDTRKAVVARAALEAGADLINDVSAFDYDPRMVDLALEAGAPACLMHAQGTPETMQISPTYGAVLLDIYDALERKVAALVARGLPRARLFVDPGIGFGKTVEHNVTILRGLTLFHGIGCGLVLGASRKSFIGTLTGASDTTARLPGSVAVALHAVSQGVQILRVHDVEETRQALTIWEHLSEMGGA